MRDEPGIYKIGPKLGASADQVVVLAIIYGPNRNREHKGPAQPPVLFTGLVLQAPPARTEPGFEGMGPADPVDSEVEPAGDLAERSVRLETEANARLSRRGRPAPGSCSP
jgi:hypothetical protein